MRSPFAFERFLELGRALPTVGRELRQPTHHRRLQLCRDRIPECAQGTRAVGDFTGDGADHQRM
jgi:hypothetical protein